jgi:hypothetical protein
VFINGSIAAPSRMYRACLVDSRLSIAFSM